jgi:hypothetical protein
MGLIGSNSRQCKELEEDKRVRWEFLLKAWLVLVNLV